MLSIIAVRGKGNAKRSIRHRQASSQEVRGGRREAWGTLEWSLKHVRPQWRKDGRENLIGSASAGRDESREAIKHLVNKSVRSDLRREGKETGQTITLSTFIFHEVARQKAR